ncbi:Arylsulfatase, partial [Tetrabaena socialis]
ENNTVVVFTSDNGFKLGNHNMAQEKFTFYEEDVRVPLLMAGPGIPRGVFVPEVAAAMTDLSATVAAIAGLADPRIPRATWAHLTGYVIFCNPKVQAGAVRQLFDLGRDPVELVNKYVEPLTGVTRRLVDRLDAVLSVLAYCSGRTCHYPFSVIHPDGRYGTKGPPRCG